MPVQEAPKRSLSPGMPSESSYFEDILEWRNTLSPDIPLPH